MSAQVAEKPAGSRKVRRGGSRKGKPNVLHRTMKAAIWETFQSIGGVEAMAAWAEDNQTEFYRIASRLIPAEVNGSLDANVKIMVVTGFPNDE